MAWYNMAWYKDGAPMQTSVPAAKHWSYRPYQPFLVDRGEILITRIVPDKTSFSIDWLTAESGEIRYGKWNEGFPFSQKIQGRQAVVEGLEPESDYQFQIVADDGRMSLVRLVRTGDYLYTPIQYLHPEDTAYAFCGRYLWSPTIVRQADGSLLASMDVGVGGGPQGITLIYRSDDDGKTWQWTCELYPCMWGKLFVFRGTTYMLACTAEHGDILLGKTTDGGYTFTAPTVLFRGSCHNLAPGPDMSPEPPYEYNGRLWFNFHWGSWEIGKHHLCLASAPADSDLLDAETWTITPPCVYDDTWPGTAVGNSNGTLEGTFLTLADGNLYILTRYGIQNCVPDYGLSILYRVQTDEPSAPPVFDRVISFPGNHSKFTVLQDEKTGVYYSIVNWIKDSANRFNRNLLTLISSDDGLHWNKVVDLFDFSDRDGNAYGFQYVDFFMEADDRYFVCRTAINNADNYHNTNVTLFRKLENFRTL